ncbi:MAG TPA: GGDEF domain-containing protein, partial [Clostridium sp.]|nr:GGDEF domain-containing protein [Clostridium sp.]
NEDNIYAICNIIVDEGERKDREYKLEKKASMLRKIIDGIPEAIFYKDKEGRVKNYNKAFKELYNSLGVTEILDKTATEVGYDEEKAKKINDIDKEIMANKEVKYYEQSIKDKEGNDIIYEYVKNFVTDDDGEICGIVGVVRDVTERKANEKRLIYLTEIDTLTGLYNRYSFEQKIKEFDNEEYFPLGIIMGDLNGLKIVNDTFGHLEGDKLIIHAANILKETCGPHVYRWGGDEFIVLLPNVTENKCNSLIRTIKKMCNKVEHDHIQVSIALGQTIKKSKDEDINECIRRVEEKVYRKKIVEKKSVRSSIIYSFKKCLEENYGGINEHSKHVMEYAKGIGEILHLKMSEMNELITAAQLHDIGKVGIDKSIINKPAKLTEEEYEIVKTHCAKGYRIINAATEFNDIAKYVLSHHERWDGKGYPLGLSGEEIPLFSRIISVADSYDAITSKRPYKEPLKHEEAMKEIERCSGTQFDPVIVNAFKKFIENDL